ncbi:hypothetical protein [Teredinibacter sp. KSP-S5-2]|uniref:hypothetical protein n=1 Tax=Teredinibacter sp. KSP-S5-2 TaxID=3034506 RepID=UPI002934990B|nr:hypothetical protein [Teredinibacter sp. KSP-S5-2]WNO09797.1 hypothetical protein P5V12_01235 [Teredinibacter sp. KSP-S5-2]
MRYPFSACLLSIPLLILLAQSSQANQWLFDANYDFETGEYGYEYDTEITTTSIQLGYQTTHWQYAIQIPYLTVTGVDTVIPNTSGQLSGRRRGANGNGNNSDTGTGTDTQTDTTTETISARKGIGDIQTSISRAFFTQKFNGTAELTATAIWATADETKYLGKGENDYIIDAYLSTKLNRWQPWMSVGYQFTGEPDNEKLNDIWLFSAGTQIDISPRFAFGFHYAYEQAITEGEDNYATANINLSHQLTKKINLGLRMEKGLTDSSPDYGYQIFSRFWF